MRFEERNVESCVRAKKIDVVSGRQEVRRVPDSRSVLLPATELNNNCACQKCALRKTEDDKANHSNNIGTIWWSL